jgi:hypothetical protein
VGVRAWAEQSRISGNALDGTYQFTVTIPQYAEIGTWKVAWLTLSDNTNKESCLVRQDLINLSLPINLTVIN